jgi:hypothetical protein
MKYDITFHPSWWNRNSGICFNEEFFNNPHTRIELDIKMRKHLFEKFGFWGIGEKDPSPRPILGSDLIASGYLFSQMLGCEIHYREDTPPEVLCRSLSDEEASDFRAPKLSETSVWQNVEEQIVLLQKEFGTVHCALNLQGILNLALDIRGQSFFIDMYEKKTIAMHLLDQCYTLLSVAGQRLKAISPSLSGGVTAITNYLAMPGLYVHSNCSVEMISLSNYQEFLLDYDIKLSKTFKPYGIHHCGSSMEHVVEGYAQVPDLAFAEIGAGSNIMLVRKALPRCHLNLRYSPVRLANISKEELREDLKQMIIDAGGPTPKVSISCVGITSEVTDQQIELFLEVLKEIHTA